ncbi:MAG: RdgB/HAM1 family non-canonical purine NTP pyrophosphatase [Candidatus Dormibacterales bacterium]
MSSGKVLAGARRDGGGPVRLVVATGNPGKVEELRTLLKAAPVEIFPLDLGVEETGTTYEENARLKAEAAAGVTGFPAIGDDSGIEVEALGGFPGVHSARIAPTQPERTAEVLRRLAGHPRPWRARFVCALALYRAGEVRVFQADRHGEVVPEPRGGGGFGYDPVFLVPEAGLTFAEMPPGQKDRWSHRAGAVRKLLESGELGRLGA